MNFSSPEHTRCVWEQIKPILRDLQKPEGSRFLGNNKFSSNSVNALLDALAENLSNIGTISIDRLNHRWGDRQNRNWVKIITFLLSEYAYYNDSEAGFWDSLFVRLRISDPQGAKPTFYNILREGFVLLGVVRAKGGYKYISTLYLQSGIPQRTLPHFAELLKYVANNLGWWNIVHRYNEIDLAQTLYDLAVENHSTRKTLRRFLKNCLDDVTSESDKPLSGQLLKYIATVALELQRRQKDPSILKNEKEREKCLQGLSLPYNFFLRNWDNLASVLTPRQVTSTRANQVIRQRKRELALRLDTLELNLQLALPEQSLWRKEWRNLNNSFCRIPQTKWESNINYPNSLEVPELCVNLHDLSDHWTWQLKDANKCDLIEWHCEGINDNFPLLIFDAETGDRLNLNSENPQITGINELVCYFPAHTNLQTNSDIEVTDACFPCLIQNWQAKQIRLNGRSATFKMIGENIDISVKWQVASSRQPTMRGLQIKGKKPIYLEAPQIYYPLGDSVEAIRIQIEDMDLQKTITEPDEKISVKLMTGEAWQEIKLNQCKTTGNYEVRLWQGNWSWSAAFTIQSQSQISANINTQPIQIQSSRHPEIPTILPIRCHGRSDFWEEQITIQGLWSFEPVIFVLSGSEENQKYNYSTQADQTGCLNLSLMSLREVLLDSDRYTLEWVRLGNSQKLIEILTEVE
ncbi:hypothetical protein [Phormidium tenue]|jgi:hypothetical protein|uniref:Uncharacterized protein n=1 Tax=Phormidium tenue FACHB-1050 TaxID=2692857 RepID=A0ABR8C6U3_9CYAN|nr:hypothetical protein [Phormidium tenue]MBD2316504.1 hypothetical protein [Phormidium tenue FACHB-1050]